MEWYSSYQFHKIHATDTSWTRFLVLEGNILVRSLVELHLVAESVLSTSPITLHPAAGSHSSCIKILKRTVTGERNPSGSCIRPIRLITALLVGSTTVDPSSILFVSLLSVSLLVCSHWLCVPALFYSFDECCHNIQEKFKELKEPEEIKKD